MFSTGLGAPISNAVAPTLQVSTSSYTYTDRGQVETISEDAPPPLAACTCNLNGTRASKTLENSVVSSYSYDAAWQLLNVTHLLPQKF